MSGPDPAGEPERTARPDDPERAELDAAEAALRRRIDAGVSDQDELRALARELREHRAREEAVWRRTVKPSLRRTGSGWAARREVGMVVLGMVAVGVVILGVVVGGALAAVAVVAVVLVAAYVVGRRGSPTG